MSIVKLIILPIFFWRTALVGIAEAMFWDEIQNFANFLITDSGQMAPAIRLVTILIPVFVALWDYTSYQESIESTISEAFKS